MRVAALVMALGLLSATAAHAGDVAGWYVGIYAGASVRNDAALSTAIGTGGFNPNGTREFPETITNSTNVDPASLAFANLFLSRKPYSAAAAVNGEFHDGSMSFDPGAMVDLTLGYDLGNAWRLEASLGRSLNDAGTVVLEPGINGDSLYGSYLPSGDWLWLVLPFGSPDYAPGRSGSASAVLGVANYASQADFLLLSGWYDLDTQTAITPYFGGGIGLARLSTEAIFDCGCGAPLTAFSNASIVPAAQLGAGLRVKLAEPVTLDIGYRYRAAASARLGFDQVSSFGPVDLLTSIHQTGAIGIHALSAGLTIALD